MNKSYLVAVLWCVLCPSVTLRAQTELTDTIREVVVTETRHERALRSTSPMHILDRRDMLVQGVTDMADALHRLPGITLRDYGGAGGMKTVSVRGFGAKHTGVSYDGVMLSECQTGEIDLSRYSLDNVGMLLLTIGDNDDIFVPARNATTPATLSIQTLALPTADNTPHLTAQMRLGSFGYASPYLRYEQSPTDRVAVSAVSEYVYAENDYPYTIKNVNETVNDHRQNSRMKQGHAELNMAWQMNTATTLSAKAYYYDNDRQLPGQVRYYSNLSRETLRDRNAFAQMLLQSHPSEQLSLKLLAKMNWASSAYDDGLKSSQITDGTYYQREAYSSFCLLYAPGEHWAADYSADYAYNNLNSTLPTDTRPYRHTVLQSATARYNSGHLTATARLLHSLYLNDAERGASAHNMRRLSPSLSIGYAMAEGLHLRLSYKEIFRSPTFNESYYFHYGSTDLKPEVTTQLNAGLTWTTHINHSRNQLTATADIYYNKVKDMILAVPYNMFVWTCINVGRVRVLGGEATARAAHQIGHHTLTATAAYSLSQAQNRTNPQSPYYGNQIAYMPKHTGSGSIGWENPWLCVALSGHGQSSRWTNNEHLDGTLIDGYAEVGLTLWRQVKLGRSSIDARLDVKNLLDKQYEIVGSYPMPGRSWQITLNYNL